MATKRVKAEVVREVVVPPAPRPDLWFVLSPSPHGSGWDISLPYELERGAMEVVRRSGLRRACVVKVPGEHTTLGIGGTR